MKSAKNYMLNRYLHEEWPIPVLSTKKYAEESNSNRELLSKFDDSLYCYIGNNSMIDTETGTILTSLNNTDPSDRLHKYRKRRSNFRYPKRHGKVQIFSNDFISLNGANETKQTKRLDAFLQQNSEKMRTKEYLHIFNDLENFPRDKKIVHNNSHKRLSSLRKFNKLCDVGVDALHATETFPNNSEKLKGLQSLILGNLTQNDDQFERSSKKQLYVRKKYGKMIFEANEDKRRKIITASPKNDEILQTSILGQSNIKKSAALMETTPDANHQDNTLGKYRLKTSNLTARNESRISYRFRHDFVLNTESTNTAAFKIRLLEKNRNSRQSTFISDVSKLDIFLLKHSKKQNLLKQHLQLQNGVQEETDLIYSENASSFDNTITSLDNISTSTLLSNIQCNESFEAPRNNQKIMKKCTQTSILSYFKRIKCSKTIERHERSHKNSGKQVIKSANISTLDSGINEGSSCIYKKETKRNVNNRLAALRNQSEKNVLSHLSFLGRSDVKGCSADNKIEELKFHNLLKDLNTVLLRNKCLTNQTHDKVLSTSMRPSLESKVNTFLGDSGVNLHPVSTKMQTNLISSEGFCESLSFETPMELNTKATWVLNQEDSNNKSSEVAIQAKIDFLNKPYQNCLILQSHKKNFHKTLAGDITVESNTDLGNNNNASYFWKSLTFDFEKDFTITSPVCNISNKENLGLTKTKPPNSMINNCILATSRINESINKLHKGMPPEAFGGISLVNSSNASFNNSNAFGNILTPSKDNETTVKQKCESIPATAAKAIMENNCQSKFCCIHSTSPSIPSTDKHMELNSAMKSISISPNLNTLAPENHISSEGISDNKTLKDLYRIYSNNKWIANSSVKLCKTNLPVELIGTKFASDNAINQDANSYKKKTNAEKNMSITSQQGFPSYEATCKVGQSNQFNQADNLSICVNNVESLEQLKDGFNGYSSDHTAHRKNSDEEVNFYFCSQNDEFTQSPSVPHNTEKRTGNKALRNKLQSKNSTLTPNSILFETNLLKQLLTEKSNIVKSYEKKQSKKNQVERQDNIVAKTCIKRYRKNKFNIFKVKRRFPTCLEETYVPKEHKSINTFINQVKNDFRNDCLSENGDRQSVITPSSYLTDESLADDLSTGSGKLTQYQKLMREGLNKLLKDQTLIFSKFSDMAPSEVDSYKVLSNIEAIILKILDDYEHNRPICLRILGNHMDNCVFENGIYQLGHSPQHKFVRYQTKKKRFNLLLCILNKVRILLDTNTKLTKREIYYQLKPDVANQGYIDRAITDISKMLNVGMWALNVTAQKGLVYGNMKLVMDTGETINCNVAGTLVPKDVMNICEIQSRAYFILVVEKESIFNKLLEEDLPNKLTRPFILITGKGYPDLNTQLFLKKLWMVMTIPVFILVDSDPDGIAIMLNYRFGSVKNAHVSQYLSVPKAKWIGVFPSEILSLELNFEILNKRELQKAEKLLQLQCVQENKGIHRQLQILLDIGLKANIESLIKSESYLSNRYLPTKFWKNDLI